MGELSAMSSRGIVLSLNEGSLLVTRYGRTLGNRIT